MKLLALDTATEWCSAALNIDGEIRDRELMAERGHGGHVLTLIDELLAEAGLALTGLDAIAFGRGPGAFTGLRLAASITQGLAYAAGLQVIAVSDLRAMAQQAMALPQLPARVLVCLDARMAEVYWAGFSSAVGCARAATPEMVARPEHMLEAAAAWLNAEPADPPARVCGAGSGFAAYPTLAAFGARLHTVLPAIRPRAREIAMLAAHDGLACSVAPEQALPVYVRDNVAVVPAAFPGSL